MSKSKKMFISLFSFCVVLFIVVFFSGCEAAQKNEAETAKQTSASQKATETKPGSFEWQTDTPENNNMSSDIFSSLNNEFKSTKITSSIVVKSGKIINEYYADGYDKNSIFSINSCSKSITGAVFGMGIQEGFIKNTGTPIFTYFPELKEGDKRKREITINHLLTHTSGFKSTEDSWYSWRSSENWVDYILKGGMQANPGTRFDYSTGNTHLLSAIFQKASGKTLYDYGKTNLFDKIGMSSTLCGTDPQGISDGGNGFKMTARDMARFGLLYARGGKWQGRQIVPEDWVKRSTSVQYKRNTGSADYGYQWWVRKFGKDDYDAFFAQGHGCQFIFVIPEIDLVVTFTSDYYDNSHSGDYWGYVNTIVNQ